MDDRITEIREAVVVLADGHLLREMTRHNTETFPPAIAVLVEAARAYADLLDSDEAIQRAARAMFDADDAYEAYEWNSDVGSWYRRMAEAAVTAFLSDPEPGDQ